MSKKQLIKEAEELKKEGIEVSKKLIYDEGYVDGWNDAIDEIKRRYG